MRKKINLFILLFLILHFSNSHFVTQLSVQAQQNESMIKNKSKVAQIKTTNTSSGIPFSLLTDWLQIPSVKLNSHSLDILVMGQPLGNYSTTYTFNYFDYQNISSVSQETLDLAYYLSFINNQTHKNLNISWVGIDFLNINSTSLIKYIDGNFNRFKFDLVLVFGAYVGLPNDNLAQFFIKFTNFGIPVITTFQNSFPGGSVYSPANIPSVTSILGLTISTNKFSDLLNPNLFGFKFTPSPVFNPDYKLYPNFLIPGVKLRLINSLETPQYLYSIHLPTLTFALGYITFLLNNPDQSPKQILGILSRNGHFISDKPGSQQGYGIPQFLISSYSNLKLLPLVLDPLRTQYKNNTVKMAPLQTVSTYLLFSSENAVNVNSVKLIDKSNRTYFERYNLRATTAPEIQEINFTLSFDKNRLPTGPSFIKINFQIPDVKTPSNFYFEVNATSNSENSVALTNITVDPTLKLLGFSSLFERDGYYRRNSPYSRHYTLFEILYKQGYRFSNFDSSKTLENELSSPTVLSLLVIDPENVSFSFLNSINTYGERGGNLMIFLDYFNGSQPFKGQSKFSIGEYQVDPELKYYFARKGIQLNEQDLNHWNFSVDAIDDGVSKHPFVLRPWVFSKGINSSFPLFPFRGYYIDTKKSKLNEKMSLTDFSRITKIGSALQNGDGKIILVGSISPLLSYFSDKYQFTLPSPSTVFERIIERTENWGGKILEFKHIPSLNPLTDTLEFSYKVAIEKSLRWSIDIISGERRNIINLTNSGNFGTIALKFDGFMEGNFNITINLTYGSFISDSKSIEVNIQYSVYRLSMLVLLWVSVLTYTIYKLLKYRGSEGKNGR